ncbi:MAG: nucleotide exchange factor GrpE [Deltaproteobacteria bacterium]|nr:nucleotide exchange factor GrpE [Deltaproteobacteria bacterium]
MKKDDAEKKKNREGREGAARPLGAIPSSPESEEGGVVPPLQEITELPSEEISRLRLELEAKAKEAADNYERFLRVCADLENYKKRAEKEKSECVNFANETLISEVLPVIDNLERALEHAVVDTPSNGGPGEQGVPPAGGISPEGVRLTISQFYAVMKKFGLEEIKAVGERFDPVMHHAISHEETEDADEGMVVREFQKGYILKGRLLRASMVAVAKRPVKAGAH